MGSDDLFKKKRKERKKRRCEFLMPKANSFLIVTEGERTEPYYFDGMRQRILEKMGGQIDVVNAPTIEISGEGCSTETLLEATERIVKKANIMYQQVWVVFDKDDFDDFDQVIRDAAAKDYHVAWSNQSFEYWIYLHFHYNDAALHRDDWVKKLDEIFKEYNLGDGKYYKNIKDIYSLVDTYDGVNVAIKHALRRMADFDAARQKPSEFDPGTTVYQLVMELKKFIDE